VVLRPGERVPAPWRDAPEVVVDGRTLDSPGPVLAALHPAWAGRKRVVVRLEVPPEALREPQRSTAEPWRLGPDFEFARERLSFLVWANNYDGATWRLGQHAIARLGAAPSDRADIRLADGTDVWCDGGPRGGLPVPVVHGETIALGRLDLTRPGDLEGVGGRSSAASSLADDQRRAALHPSGPARVIAPAGAGKTRVLAARLQHMLGPRGYEPEVVTAVAYNKRAALELEERVAGTGARVRTLHSLGYEVLRRRGGARLIQEREVRQAVARLARVEPERGKDPLAAWIEALAEVRLALRDPEEVEKRRKLEGFARFFPRWREWMRDEGVCDHDEQIYGAIEHLLGDPEERRRVQRQCRHLLVDEFQDLTPAYLLLVRLLASPSLQVFGVGDDDQVIYGYMGATPRFLIHFDRYFPGAREYALETNYRCHPQIVEAASHLLGRNRVRVPKRIVAGALDHDGGLLGTTVTALEMAAAVKRAVVQLLERGHRPAQVAVLARVNDGLLPVQLVLEDAGVACNAPIDASLLDRSGVRAALAWVALAAASPQELPSSRLQEAMMRPSRKIRRATADRLGAYRDWREPEVFEVARDLPRWEGDLVRAFLQDVQRVRGMATRGMGVGEILRHVRQRIGLGEEMTGLDMSRSDASGSGHVDQLLALEQVAPLHPHPATFEGWLRERLSTAVGGREGVTLSTIHRVKGMEWDFVVVFGASEGTMPHQLAEDVEEERRVFHVAVTRARRAAIVLGESERPSRFIAEMKDEPPPSRRGSKKLKKSSLDPLPAVVGLSLEAPHPGVICAVEKDHVLLALEGRGKLRLSYGERVTAGGRRARLARPQS
jgi:DNA helicase-2/ATP-dependent DNA helicase PcrA